MRAQENQFGGQDRADAARRMIVLAVQQAEDALPPASGQAFAYEYNAEKDTYTRDSSLGPTTLRSTRPIGKHKFSLRLSASYFDINQSFTPITYQITPVDPNIANPRGFAKFGLDAKARVGVLNFGASYGVTNWLDVFLSLPVTIVDARASESFTTDPSLSNNHVVGAPTRDALDALLKGGALVYRRESFRNLGFDFNDGTHGGVGRISFGARAVVLANERVRLAFAPEFFCPSPSEHEFAGSASPAVLPRLIGEATITDSFRLLVDTGYDYDFQEAELRRFIAGAGLLYAQRNMSVDIGLSGSLFNKPVAWTPAVAYGRETAPYPSTLAVAQEDNKLGDDFVDLTIGAKYALSTNTAVSGAVVVPLNDQGFRPAAFGTIALEVYR